MTWLRIDDGFPGHRKVRRLSDGAFRLHITALCMCAHDLTDGHVTREDIDELVAIRQADKRITELVTRGLWEPVDGGWRVHDYLHFNPSRADVEAEREASRERHRRWKARRRAPATDQADQADAGVTPLATRERRVSNA